MIRFSCPECETALKAGDDKAGGMIGCPRCKSHVKVPGQNSKKKTEDVVELEELEDLDEEEALPPSKRDRPAKKKSPVGLFVAIAIAACVFTSIAGGIIGAKLLSSKGDNDVVAKNTGGPPPAPFTFTPGQPLPESPKTTGDAPKPPSGETPKPPSGETPKPPS